MKKDLELKDISSVEGQMTTVDLKDLPNLPIDEHKHEWKPFTDEQKANVCCILDDVCVLNIPKPKSPAEEEELVKERTSVG